jgi:TetR/AcrR family transcriptional regulator, mexJK operon transcriptional repressor
MPELNYTVQLLLSAMLDPPETTGRSAGKRLAVLDAARAAFLSGGYLGTSMDEIAARAGVSKATVYNHFEDKQSLFTAIVTETVDATTNVNTAEVLALAASGDLAADLRTLAHRQLTRVMQPELLALRRLVIGESARFPGLGRLFYERGAGPTLVALAESFARLDAEGALRISDPALAAAHFNWLIMSSPINRAMLLGETIPPEEELERIVEAGVRVFLAAYQ